jgi:hypothetical protein
MNLFSQEATLQELITKNKITLKNKEVLFDENDEETRDVYDQLGIHSMSPESVDVNFKPVAFSGGYGIFPDKETAMEYSMFCGCGGMIEDYMFKGEKMYLGCSKKKKNLSFSLDDEKRIIYTPIMLAGKMIPRVNAMGEKYYVKFTPESIQKMAYKYIKEKREIKINPEIKRYYNS